MLIATFEGYCPMQTDDDVLYVCTPKGAHCRHEAAMIINANQVDINASNKRPDFLFVSPEGNPYYLYHLDGAKVSMGTQTRQEPRYSAKGTTMILDFGELHSMCVMHDRSTFNGDGQFALNGGEVTALDDHSLQLKRNGQPHQAARQVAERVEWTLDTGDLQILFNGRLIAPAGKRVDVAIANTRPGPNGLSHFDLYYDLIEQHDGYRFQIEYAKPDETDGATGKASPRYGNCVPPVRLPA